MGIKKMTNKTSCVDFHATELRLQTEKDQSYGKFFHLLSMAFIFFCYFCLLCFVLFLERFII